MVTLLSSALAAIRSSSPFPVRSAAARLVGSAVVEKAVAAGRPGRLRAHRVDRDGEDELIGRQRGVKVSVGGGDGELRPDRAGS